MATRQITEDVARIIRAELRTRGLSQEWLSEASGISMRTLARRLHASNPSSMPLDELAAIAAALDVPLTALLPTGAKAAA